MLGFLQHFCLQKDSLMVANTPHGKILLIGHKMATFSLDEFRSRLSNLGIARPNRFQVILPELGNGAALPSLFCESSSLPPLAVLTRSQRIQGPLHQRASNLDYGGGGISMTFYVDSNMDVKRYFDTWVHMTVNPASFTVNYYDEYAKSIKISQLDERDNEKYQIELIEAFPTSLGVMELNQGSNDTVHRLTVTFSYRYWRSDSISQTDVGQSTAQPSDQAIEQGGSGGGPVGQTLGQDPGYNLRTDTWGTVPDFRAGGGQFAGGGASGSF